MAIPAGISEQELHVRIKEIEKLQLVKTIEAIASGELKLEEVSS